MRAVIIALGFFSLLSTARGESIFTPTNGPSCKDASKEFMGNWTCPGPGGYAAQFTDEGNMVSVTFAPKMLLNKAGATAVWRGAGKVFGEKIGWILKDGRPKSAVLRKWATETDTNGNEREVQSLGVYALNSDKACVYAEVDVRKPRADEVAANFASEAVNWRCTEK